MIDMLIGMVLLTFLAISGVAINNMRNLLATAMLSGIFSLLSAALFVSMDAVDVAFTEAAVGAGIATILLLGALAACGHGFSAPAKRSPFALLVVCLTGALLIYGTLDIPPYADPNAPVQQHINPFYLEKTGSDIHIPNVVTAVLASFRGYDTMGEVIVIFTAGIGVLMLLGRQRRSLAPTASRSRPTDEEESS